MWGGRDGSFCSNESGVFVVGQVGECITADYAGDTNSCAIAQHALEKCVSGASIRDANMDAKQGRLTIPWGCVQNNVSLGLCVPPCMMFP